MTEHETMNLAIALVVTFAVGIAWGMLILTFVIRRMEKREDRIHQERIDELNRKRSL